MIYVVGMRPVINFLDNYMNVFLVQPYVEMIYVEGVLYKIWFILM